MSGAFNTFQRALKDVYASGEFAHVTTPQQVEGTGDSLFAFLMREVSTAEDCASKEDALRRLQTVLLDVTAAIDGVNRV